LPYSLKYLVPLKSSFDYNLPLKLFGAFSGVPIINVDEYLAFGNIG
jgi:hypothetical protein